MTTIQLPWPPKELSPNARVHWSKKAVAVKRYRHACGWACKAAGIAVPAEGPIHLHLVFVPPNRRHRDIDNCLASIKSGLDGIADALGVNDSRFKLTHEISDDIGGFINVTIEGS